MPAVAERLTDSLERLRRALDRSRLYGVRHPESVAAIDEVWPSLADAIAVAAPLTLAAGVDGLRFKGQLVAAEDEDKQGLGRLLHREGIAAITLHPDLTRAELERFLDIVRVNLALPEHEEETLESLLWQARLQGLGFQAVAELMEAEAISGDAVRYLQQRGPTAVEVILGQGSAAGAERGPLSHDQLVQAIEAAGDDAELAEDEESAWDVDDAAWQQELSTALEADADTIARERSAVALELPGDQIGRAAALLYRVARARRTELRPGEAVALVRLSVAEIARQRDPFALVQLIAASESARQAETDSRVLRMIDNVVEVATQPTFIARLLAAAGPDADPAATDQLVSMLDDAAIQALIEWSFAEGADEDSVERGRWLVGALGDVTAARARRWLSEDSTPPRLLEPAALLLRGRDQAEDRALRPRLLSHASTRVQEIALQWYADTGIPDDEVDALFARLLDRRPRVRQATWPLLAAHTPAGAPRWFRQHLNPRTLAERPDDLQRDLCVGAAAVLGSAALPMLQQLLDHKVGFFAGRGQARLLQVAAEGIARVGGPAARDLLEEGSRSWVGARGQACKQALAHLDQGTK